MNTHIKMHTCKNLIYNSTFEIKPNRKKNWNLNNSCQIASNAQVHRGISSLVFVKLHGTNDVINPDDTTNGVVMLQIM